MIHRQPFAVALAFAAAFFVTPLSAQNTAGENQESGLSWSRYPSSFHSRNPLTPSSPVLLRFNANVSAETARDYISFYDEKNDRSIAAKVTSVTPKDVLAFRPTMKVDATRTLAVGNYVRVRPVRPLPVGVTWYLRVRRGLKSVDGNRALAEDRSNYFGKLNAFAIRSIEAQNFFDSDLSIEIDHSKNRMNAAFTVEKLGEYISLSPKPKGYEIVDDGHLFRLKGDFEYGKEYQVSVKPGLVANDTIVLNQHYTEKVVFEPNDGFVTLPAFSTTQNAKGHRNFDVQSGNLKAMRVQVKKLEGQALLHSLKGYDEEYEGWGDKRTIPFGMVSGKPVFDQTIKRKAALDKTETVNLKWDEMGAGNEFGAFYFCAEGKSDTESEKEVGAQAIIQLTDIGLAWKQTDLETVIYAFSLSNGEPLQGVQMELFTDGIESLLKKETAENGIVHLPAATYREKAEWLDAKLGDDRHVMRFQDELETVGLWSFSVPYRYDDPQEGERRTLIFTDRDVYKPGDEVFVKAISRFIDADSLLPGGGGAAKMRVFDSRHRKLFEKEVTMSERGSFDDQFTLPMNRLGWYSLELDFNTVDDSEEGFSYRKLFNHSFQVEEYRVNTFEVSVHSEDAYTMGKEIEIPVSAKYYMGKPLSKSLLDWNVYATESYPRPKGFDEFDFGDPLVDDSSFSKSENLHLSSDGEAVVRLEIPVEEEHPMPKRVSLSAQVTDANQQSITNNVSFVIHSSEFYLGIRKPEGTHRAGDSVRFALATVGANGKVYTKPIDATIKVEKENWTTVKVRGAGGKMTHRNERVLKLQSEESKAIQTSIDPISGLASTVSQELTFDEAGDYFVSVSTKDEQGRSVVTRTKFHVIGVDEPSWSWHDVVRIDMIPDKSDYVKGETAKVLVRTPVFGHGLITTERGGVRSVSTQLINQHETVLEVPIGAGDAPNVFVSALIIRGSDDSPHKHTSADYRMGYCQIKVEDPAAHLAVKVDVGEEEYFQPGQQVEIEAQVFDSTGAGVSNAEVTLYAVDEGVLSLTGYQTPEPSSIFHREFPLNVWTGQSLSSLLPENPLEQDFGNKGYVIGGGGVGQGLNPDRVRKNFKAVAFWKGAIMTDAEGKVKASFEAPDNLTTFRVMAIAAEGNRFGHGEKDLIVNKPLIIEPALPGFSNVTDQIDLSAVLHNNTDSAQEVEVSVTLDKHAVFLKEIRDVIPTNLEAGKNNLRRTERMTLEAGETDTLRFPVGMMKTGEATWNWKVQSLTDAKLKDATESKLEVGYPVPLLRESKTIAIRNEEDLNNLLDSVSPRLLNGRGDVNVKLSNSRIIEATDGLEYLLQYPYGCVEQTTSSTIPWLSTQRMEGSLPGLDKSEAEVAAAVKKGIDRLFSMQTSDGGLGYWPGANQSVLWGSAYGGMAIALAGQNGMVLPKEQSEALWKYLSKSLRDVEKVDSSYELSQRCLSLYTLALVGKSEPAYHEKLIGKMSDLPVEGRALLALAITTSHPEGVDGAKAQVDALLKMPKKSPTSQVSWYKQPYLIATRLLAAVQKDGSGPHIDELVEELMAIRTPHIGWGSTYSNAWPLLALSAYSDANLSSLSANKIGIHFADNNSEVGLTPVPSSGGASFPFEGDVRSKPLSLTVENNSPVYAHVEVATQPKMISMEPENKGFGIARSYHKVETDGSIVSADDLMVGDLVLVKLDVNIPKQRESYLAIDDPLPAILEAVNPDFKTAGATNAAIKTKVRRLYANHKELKKERALFFADRVYQAGDYSLQYLARVVAPGNVVAPPAKIEAMYEPSRFGLSGTLRISAKPLDLGKNRVAAR